MPAQLRVVKGTPDTESNLLPPEMLNEQFPANELYSSSRANMLTYREKFFECTQHDHKVYDWRGRTRSSGRPNPGAQDLLGNSQPTHFVPLDQRRPASPYRIGVTIVGQFTSLVFGAGKFPSWVSDDPVTKDFVEQLSKETELEVKMIIARNKGGSSGTVGLSWSFDSGKVRVRVHSGKQIHVLKWQDREELIPAHVVELYQTTKLVYDASKRKHVEQVFWFRRDWTLEAEIHFHPCEVTSVNPVQWRIDHDQTIEYTPGRCRFVWIQNLPQEDFEDGTPDYEGTYEQMNELDILNSVNVGGVIKNLDPTLLIKCQDDLLDDATISKGSDNALAVGIDGDASYLELSGASAGVGKTTIEGQREQVLEVAQCVVPDPDKVVSAGTSGRTMERLFGRSLDKASLYRTQYGKGMLRLVTHIVEDAREYMPDASAETPEEKYPVVSVLDDEGNPVLDDEGNEQIEPVEYTLLKPRIETEVVLDAEGRPTGEVTTKTVPRHPGKGTIDLKWPKFFEETPEDVQKEAGALGAANGNKPFMSQESSVEQWASQRGLDPKKEKARLDLEAEREAALQFGGLMPNADPGGDVTPPNNTPPNSDEETPPPADEA